MRRLPPGSLFPSACHCEPVCTLAWQSVPQKGDLMKLFTPAYYHKFTCIASRCPDSCCKDWAVDIDKDAAALYRSLQGDLGDRLRAVLEDTDDGTCMRIENGRCPMWRTDGLCRIQAELGHDALSHTCRTFPRLRHDYGDFIELGLELSCPEAARLILTEDATVTCGEIPGGEEADYEKDIMQILLRSRKTALQFLDESPYPVPQTLAVLLLYAHSVQAELDGGAEAILSPADDLADAEHYATVGDLSALVDFFKGLEILTPTWQDRLNNACHCEGATRPWQSVLPRHCEERSDVAIRPLAPWNAQYKALFRYFVNRYWLQAVSDYDLIGRVKFATAACILIRALGGDLIATAQAFSKEIENAPDNMDAILDGTYTSPALTDTQLLSLLLSPAT